MQYVYTKDLDAENLSHSKAARGSIYKVTNDVGYHVGWVAKGDGEWLAWNRHGDFWTGSAPSRNEALAQMVEASWMRFVRA